MVVWYCPSVRQVLLPAEHSRGASAAGYQKDLASLLSRSFHVALKAVVSETVSGAQLYQRLLHQRLYTWLLG